MLANDTRWALSTLDNVDEHLADALKTLEEAKAHVNTLIASHAGEQNGAGVELLAKMFVAYRGFAQTLKEIDGEIKEQIGTGAAIGATEGALHAALKDAMERGEVTSLKISGHTVFLKTSYTFKPTGGKQELLAALKASEDTNPFVHEDYNYNTVRAYFKELEQNGQGEPILPAHLVGKVEVNDVFTVSSKWSG